MATNVQDATEVFAVDFAALAREISMDIFPLEQILELHKLTDAEWSRIQANAKFKSMLDGMVRDWSAAQNTKERVRVKAATGLESILERYILDIADPTIPLNQRVEAGKFLARLGELDGQRIEGGGGGGFSIQINIGAVTKTVDVPAYVSKVIEGTAIPEIEA